MPASRTRKPPAKKAARPRAAAKKAPARKAPVKPLKGAALKARTGEIERRLRAEYPDAHCELDYKNPLQLAVATILSAQCTDKRVNLVTPALFKRYPNAAALADADPLELEQIIRSAGFYRMKAKNITGMAKALVAGHGGKVPPVMDELVVLPGIGRKTANVILGNAYGMNEGMAVDTHVMRLSGRLGLTAETDPVKIERELTAVVPRESWTTFSHLLIWHGRRVCHAKNPRHDICVLRDICPSAG